MAEQWGKFTSYIIYMINKSEDYAGNMLCDIIACAEDDSCSKVIIENFDDIIKMTKLLGRSTHNLFVGLANNIKIIEKIPFNQILFLLEYSKNFSYIINFLGGFCRGKGIDARIMRIVGLLEGRIEQAGFDQQRLFESLREDIGENLSLYLEEVILLLKNGIAPTKHLLGELHRTKHKKELVEGWINYKKTKEFDIKNKLLIELYYSDYRKLVDFCSKKKHDLTYKDYLKILKYGFKGVGFCAKELVEIRYAAYESYLLYRFIKKIKSLGKEVIVVSNLSYGRTLTEPCERSLKGVSFITARIGSTECHDNFFYLKENLFDRAFIKYLLVKKPILIIVDGTEHIAGEKKHFRYPDAFIGYTNYFAALNASLGIRNPDLLQRNPSYSLKINRKFSRMINYFKERIKYLNVNKKPYKVYYHNFMNVDLFARKNRVANFKPERFNLAKARQEINKYVPVILVNGTILNKFIPKKIKSGFFKHKAAFFDDREEVIKIAFFVSKKGIELNNRAFYDKLDQRFEDILKLKPK